MSFKIGDKAVYASHGIGEVTGIERREISGRKERFYVLKLLDSGHMVMVPTAQAKSRGMRNIIGRKEVKQVLAVLGQTLERVPRQNWNRRHRGYMTKLKSGSLYEVAEVLRELSLIRSRKPLSFSERRLLESARSLLVHELALAKSTPVARMEKEVDAILG